MSAVEKGPRIRASNFGEDRVMLPIPVKIVNIMGMGSSVGDYVSGGYARPDAFADPLEEQVWVLNGAIFIFRHHLGFLMDDFSLLADYPQYRPAHLNRTGVPLVMSEARADVERSMEYPLQEVIEEFNDGYLRNSVAYMIAYAMLCRKKFGDAGPQELRFYGCDYSHPNSPPGVYEHGRACVEYWAGKADQMGIRIMVAPHSSFLDTWDRFTGQIPSFYGYAKKPQVVLDMATNVRRLTGFTPAFGEMENAVDGPANVSQPSVDGVAEGDDPGHAHPVARKARRKVVRA